MPAGDGVAVIKYVSPHVKALRAMKLPVGRGELRDWENRRPVKVAKGRGNYIAARHARRAGEAQFRKNLTAATRSMGLSRAQRVVLVLSLIAFGEAVNEHVESRSSG